MTLRENAMAIYNREQPDFYGDLMDAIELIPDPVLVGDMCPQDGLEHKDSWGTVYVFKPGAPGPHPRVNHENAVIKDIEHWESQLKVPSLKNLDWAPAKEAAENAAAGVDLLVSGHTHGGQIFPGGLLIRWMGRLNYGLYQEGGCRIIVSSGAGGWGVPLRTQARCEYVVIHLQKA